MTIISDIRGAVKHGKHSGHKAKRAIRQAKKMRRAVKHHDIAGALKFAKKAGKSGYQSGKQAAKGAKHAKKGAGRILKAGASAAGGNYTGAAGAFVE
jgi:hypothetical protein